MGLEQDTVPRERHVRFYTERGTDIFAVDDILYKVHADLLGLQGGVLKDLFTLPQSPESREGLTDDRPIVLPQVTKGEFEHYLELIYDPMKLPPHSIQKVVDILKLASQWEIQGARNWAIHHLDQMTDVPASLRLKLGRKFDIPDWIEPAFHNLVFNIPLRNLRGDDFTHLNYQVFILLSKLKEALQDERRAIAYNPPDLPTHSPSCSAPQRCGTFWREAWWLTIGRKLLNPDQGDTLLLAAGPETVRSMDWSGMNAACRETAVDRVCSGAGFAGMEKLFKQGMQRLGELPVE
ncbi:hypothetical protein K466DRAFT_600269 [Polyporus arcularius HHB13444]|uniref:BTB domain-containing protein n=1 Tax=Polyporus arcularius HHB13444 TaxID=1314778 RepID=A0A5C3PA11_9APHY|nr:hypothetical protein K466DRAFT_600269 [Polyporus arcularius HHB13444]